MANAEMLERVLDLVRAEVYRATELHGPFHSSHEGFAVLFEEVDELWDEVKANDAGKAWQEAIQVAAMAVRFLIDCAPTPLKERLQAPMCLLPSTIPTEQKQ